jgi:hypothetical protein
MLRRNDEEFSAIVSEKISSYFMRINRKIANLNVYYLSARVKLFFAALIVGWKFKWEMGDAMKIYFSLLPSRVLHRIQLDD